MNQIEKYILYPLFILLALGSCDRVSEDESDFDNKLYINEARVKETDKILVKPLDSTLVRTIQASIALPENHDIKLQYKVDGSQVNHYNSVYGAKAELLPAKYYEIPESRDTIFAGKVASNKTKVIFKNMNDFPRGEKKTYVLPVTIADANFSILKSSQTIFYIVREGPPIVTAANIKGTSLKLKNPGSSTMAGMSKITMELLMYPQEWAVSDAGISSIMGIEGYYLWRIGDASIPNNQVQLARTSRHGGNWSPNGGKLNTGVWQHVAITQDLITGEQKFYVNGKLLEKSTGGTGGIINFNSSNFYVGESYGGRHFNGYVSEMRIWSVIRTQTELQSSFYQVSPSTEGLEAYWRFNEGTGNQIHDYTGHNNELKITTGKPNIAWVDVELGGDEE